jgi:hypothetical protein
MSRFGYTVAGFGGGYPAAAGGFNIGAGEPAATIEARTGDPAGFITWATDTFDVYVSDGNDNWAVTINRPNL